MTTRAVSVALTAACSLLLAAAPAGWGATFEVRVNTDQADPKPGDGVCSTVGAAIPPDPDTCTLRAAIQNANQDQSEDRIHFSLTGSAQISLTDFLPDLRSIVDIDGWNGAAPAASSIPRPAVRIDGSGLPRIQCPDVIDTNADNPGSAFVARGLHVRINGLAISGFPCDDIVVWDADGHGDHRQLHRHERGRHGDGRIRRSAADKDGVYVGHASAMTIGGPSAGRGQRHLDADGRRRLRHRRIERRDDRPNKIGVNPAAGDMPRAGRRPPQVRHRPWGSDAAVHTDAANRDRPVIADNQVAGLDGADNEAAAIADRRRRGPGSTWSATSWAPTRRATGCVGPGQPFSAAGGRRDRRARVRRDEASRTEP